MFLSFEYAPYIYNIVRRFFNLFFSFFFVKGGYGFNIKGGRDKPFREGDTCVYITRLRPGATAEKDGRLSPGDRIVEVRSTSLFAQIVCTRLRKTFQLR